MVYFVGVPKGREQNKPRFLNVSVCRVATALELPGTRKNDAAPGNGKDPYFFNDAERRQVHPWVRYPGLRPG
jgi:hypothetical protein